MCHSHWPGDGIETLSIDPRPKGTLVIGTRENT